MSNGMVRSGVSDPNSSDVHASRLIEQYTPLIYKVARRLGFAQKDHYHEGMEMDDAIQSGRLGLWFASQSYDDSHGMPFVAWAYAKIREEILNEMRRCGWSTGMRTKKVVRIEHRDFWDTPDDVDIEDEVMALQWQERLELAVNELDAKRRNIYQGVMIHDGHGKNGSGKQYCKQEDISQTWLSILRQDIRGKLKEALH